MLFLIYSNYDLNLHFADGVLVLRVEDVAAYVELARKRALYRLNRVFFADRVFILRVEDVVTYVELARKRALYRLNRVFFADRVFILRVEDVVTYVELARKRALYRKKSSCNLFHYEGLKYIPLFDVVKLGKTNTALVARCNLFGIIFKSLE